MASIIDGLTAGINTVVDTLGDYFSPPPAKAAPPLSWSSTPDSGWHPPLKLPEGRVPTSFTFSWNQNPLPEFASPQVTNRGFGSPSNYVNFFGPLRLPGKEEPRFVSPLAPTVVRSLNGFGANVPASGSNSTLVEQPSLFGINKQGQLGPGLELSAGAGLFGVGLLTGLASGGLGWAAGAVPMTYGAAHMLNAVNDIRNGYLTDGPMANVAQRFGASRQDGLMSQIASDALAAALLLPIAALGSRASLVLPMVKDDSI